MVTHAQPAPARNGTGQWWPSKYGSGDQAGALNEITPGKVLEAVRLVRRGRLYDLAHVLHHLQEGDRTYNGFLLADIIEDHGTNRLGIDTLPQVVTRGLLLDVAAARGGERLGPGEVITVADAENALASTGHEVRPGDAVFFHTCWGSLWGTDNERYAAGEPGPGRALGQWLADHQVALTGCDTWSFGAYPAEDPREPFVVPQTLNVRYGIVVVENLRLAEIAEAHVHEYLLVISHAKLRGATGAWVAPLAII